MEIAVFITCNWNHAFGEKVRIHRGKRKHALLNSLFGVVAVAKVRLEAIVDKPDEVEQSGWPALRQSASKKGPS